MGLDFPCSQANEVKKKKKSQNELIRKLHSKGSMKQYEQKNSSYYAYNSNDFPFF
jgi:hypothetical protein